MSEWEKEGDSPGAILSTSCESWVDQKKDCFKIIWNRSYMKSFTSEKWSRAASKSLAKYSRSFVVDFEEVAIAHKNRTHLQPLF